MPLIMLLGLAGFASALSLRATDPLLPLIASDLVVTIGEAAMLVSAYTLPYSLMQLVLGPVADALGKARLIRACAVILTVGLALSAIAPGYATLATARALAGGFAGGLIPVSMALIGDRVPFDGRQLAISRFLLWVIIGQLVGSAGSGLLGEAIGWRGVFALTAVVTGIMAVLALTMLRDAGVARTPLSWHGSIARYAEVLRNPRALPVIGVVALEGMLFFGQMPFVAPLLIERGAGASFEAGLVISAFAIGGIGYSLIVRWLLRVLGPTRMMALGGVLGGAALAASALPLAWPGTAAGFAVAGLGFFMLHNTLQTEATELASAARGSALAMFACAFFLGQGSGVIMIRHASAAAGLPVVYVVIGCAIIALGFIASRLLRRPRSPSTTADVLERGTS